MYRLSSMTFASVTMLDGSKPNPGYQAAEGQPDKAG